MYSPKHDRVILPQYSIRGGIAAYAARGKPGTIPKYLTKKDTSNPGLQYGISDTVIVCEDILSAIKLARFYSSYPLLGVNINDKQFKYLLSIAKNIVIYLDNDSALVKAKALKLYRRFSLYIPARVITSEKEPKSLTSSEIENLLH